MRIFEDCFGQKLVIPAQHNIADYLNIKNYSAVIIITDNIVADLYLENFKNNLIKADNNYLIDNYIIKSGEKSKTRYTKELIEDYLLAKNYDKNICILALGGGVVTDLAGFIASTYLRGVSVIYYPTSLLAMVDAAIGGKTAVNTIYGKNLIGSFKQPDSIWINLNILSSLSEQEYINAFAEIIKHGLICDREYFDFLANNIDILINNKTSKNKDYIEVLKFVINKSQDIKLNIVSEDPTEQSGIRYLLNFGHTIGHAIEAASDYKISHGYAVAMGIAIESYIALELNILNKADYDLIIKILGLYKLINNNVCFEFNLEKIKKYLYTDKKNIDNQIQIVLLRAIGQPYITKNITKKKGSDAKTSFKYTKYTHSVDFSIINSALTAYFT